MRCHIIEGGWPRDEQCASKASQWVSRGGTAGSQTYQPPCLVLFIPFHKTSLSCILSRNHCGLVKENVSRVRSGSRVGTYSYLVSERGQTVLDGASGIFCWFAALLPWSFGTVGLVNPPFSVHINTELLGWELWREHGDILGKLETPSHLRGFCPMSTKPWQVICVCVHMCVSVCVCICASAHGH